MAQMTEVPVPAGDWTQVSTGEKYFTARMPKVGRHYYAISATKPTDAPDVDAHPFQWVMDSEPIELGQLGATDYVWLYLSQAQVVAPITGDDV